MGATFQAYRQDYKEETEDNIPYSAIFRYRAMLIRRVHPEWEDEFRELFTWRDEDKQNETFSKIVDGLRKEGFNDFGEVTSSISLGCAYFINHPDDGGCFNESQCKHIANAFKQLMKTDIVQDEHDRRRIGQLIGVFEKGSADYHGVRIL